MSAFALWFKYDVKLLTRTDYSTRMHNEVLARVRANATLLIAGTYREADTGL
jgi:hypothetical protein